MTSGSNDEMMMNQVFSFAVPVSCLHIVPGYDVDIGFQLAESGSTAKGQSLDKAREQILPREGAG